MDAIWKIIHEIDTRLLAVFKCRTNLHYPCILKRERETKGLLEGVFLMSDTRNMVPKSSVQRWYLSFIEGMIFQVSNSYCLPLHGSAQRWFTVGPPSTPSTTLAQQ